MHGHLNVIKDSNSNQTVSFEGHQTSGTVVKTADGLQQSHTVKQFRIPTLQQSHTVKQFRIPTLQQSHTVKQFPIPTLQQSHSL